MNLEAQQDAHNPLGVDALYHACDPDQLAFSSTDELAPLAEPLGQDRALEAINFGVEINQDGFNLFVVGEPGLGKRHLLKEILEQRASSATAPCDWCYVNNFKDPQKPGILRLPAGSGEKLRQHMEQLLEDLMTALPSSFQSEEYRTRLQEIEDDFEQQQAHAFSAMVERAREQNVAVVRTPAGYTLAPMAEDKLLDPKEFEKLPKEEQDRIEKVIEGVQVQLRDVIRDFPLKQREHYKQVKALRNEITRLTVDKMIDWLEQQWAEQAHVLEYIAAVKENVIENAEEFLSAEGAAEVDNVRQRASQFHQYAVNVLVDNRNAQGAPVVFEDNPTYQNLVGRVEHIAQMGTLLTDFTLIKGGALHRANGGYLVLDARKVLSSVYAWDGLKRAISSRVIKIESLEKMLSLASTISLEPEPIELDIKLILVGEPVLYYLLKAYDPEFGLLFKVSADFSETAERNPQNTGLYAQLIASLQARSNIRPLDKSGVARVIEHASRLADDGEKLSLGLENLQDLLREADYWSKKNGDGLIGSDDIQTAIDKQRYRQDRIREQVHEHITRGIRLVDTQGEKVAQVNGLSVMQLGDFAFGMPSRITATARLGSGKLIDIEREVELGGHIHSKGVLILSSYLASTYAKDYPLPLAASLVFEQSYGRVDGDSASAAELCVLLSAIGQIPVKQSFAVTGSINQLGEIQAIGGVNEKIEGFFEICKARELTGEQGVIIPQANRVHLMLNRDVRDAVRDGKFRVYTAAHVEDVMELLSGLSRGKARADGKYTEGSFNRVVQDRIVELQKLHKKFASRKDENNEDNKRG